MSFFRSWCYHSNREHTKTAVHVSAHGYCCVRTARSAGKAVKDGGNLGLEKLLSSLSCCGNLEANAESGADDGGLACEVSGVSKDYGAVHVLLELRFEVLSARVEESAVTHRRPELIKVFQILKVCLEQRDGILAH